MGQADPGARVVFAALGARGIEVVSMRNKANRLEELFMRLVEGRDGVVHPQRLFRWAAAS
jgi:hypothetical protein